MPVDLPSVLILHNRPAPDGGASEAGVLDEVRAVAAALREAGIAHTVADADAFEDLPGILAAHREPVVFNLVEGFARESARAALVPAVCEAFGRGCTGNDAACQALALDKARAKAVLRGAGLPVPPATIVPPGARPARRDLPPFPVIVKPLATDASEGIFADSVVARPGPALDAALHRVHRRFRQSALVESFFGHRELNVALLQRSRRVTALPIAEIEFRDYDARRPRIVDYAAKWQPDSFAYRNTVRVVPAPLPPRVAARVRELALAVWRALGCRDYARVDFRLDAADEAAILEVNPNPDISPDAGFSAALHAGRVSFPAFVRAMVQNAAMRTHALRHQRPS